MNKDEALRLLERELDAFRAESYEALVRRIDEDPVVSEHVGMDAATYQLEIQVLWDGRPGDARAGGADAEHAPAIRRDAAARLLRAGMENLHAGQRGSVIKSADGRFVDDV